MSAELLLREFERLSEAPDAVSKLRRFVLDLAVRGKLAAPDATDEPVSKLAQRIRQAKRCTLPFQRREMGRGVPFAIPANWLWISLHELGELSGGLTPSKGRADFWDGEIKWFSSRDIKADEVTDSALKISSTAVKDTRLRVYPVGCLLMVARSGILKRTFPVAINRAPATVNQDLKVLHPYVGGLERYLQCALRGLTTWILSHYVKTGTTVQSLKYEEFERLPIPLPPLAEQQRIVARVEELMALCDRLEAAQAERERRRQGASIASLRQVTNAGTATDLARTVRSYSDQLQVLSRRPQQISLLRSAILHAAATGTLRNAFCSGPTQAKGRGQASAHWPRRRLDEVAEQIVDCPHSTPKWTASGKICVRTNQFRPGSLDLNSVRYVSEATYRERIQRLTPTTDDVLYSREGGILGVACRVPPDTELCLGQRMMLIRASNVIDPPFLEMVLNSPPITALAKAATTGGAAPRVNVATVRAYPIPVPSLPEQRETMAKVNELMALCDQLETRVSEVDTERARLLDAAIQKALHDA